MKQRTLIKIKTSKKKKIAEEAEQKKQGLKKQPCIILIGWRNICNPVGLCACPKDLLSKSTSVTVKDRSKGTKAVPVTVSFLSACSCVSGWVDGWMDKWMDWWMDGNQSWRSAPYFTGCWPCFPSPLILQPLDSKHEQASKSADADHSHHNWFCETRHVITTFARSKETTRSRWWLSFAAWCRAEHAQRKSPSFFLTEKNSFANYADKKTNPAVFYCASLFFLSKGNKRWSKDGSREEVGTKSPRGRHESFIYYLLNVWAYAGF